MYKYNTIQYNGEMEGRQRERLRERQRKIQERDGERQRYTWRTCKVGFPVWRGPMATMAIALDRN